jgi:hypothetical protein
MKTLLALLPLATLAQTSTVIVVPADLVPAANQAALHFDPVGGTNTFTVQVVTAGTTNIYGCWAATPFSATNRAALTFMASQPPFTGRLLVMDYDLTNGAAPFKFLATHGLAVYSPPMFTQP